MDLKERYLREYFEHLGYDLEKDFQAAVDGELSLRYPVIVKKIGGKTVVCVTEAISEALEAIEELPENSGFEEVMELLFEPETPFERDVSYIGAHEKDSFRPLGMPPGIEARVLTKADRRIFRELSRTLTERERGLAQVSLGDRHVIGLFEGGELVSAASVLIWNKIMDIGVMTRADSRRRGLGALAVSRLMEELLPEGNIFQYRCDESNAASCGLMRALGFIPVVEMTGAILKI